MDYAKDLLFEWDEKKSQNCLKLRGLNFQLATEAFHDPMRIILEDERFTYSEQRWLCYGKINNRLHCVVFTLRDNRIRIISARKANRREARKL